MAEGKAWVRCWRGVFQQKVTSLSHPSGVGREECYHPLLAEKTGGLQRLKDLQSCLQGEGATQEPGQVQPDSSVKLQSWALWNIWTESGSDLGVWGAGTSGFKL